MLEQVILSIDITMPFILLALLGILLKRRGMINDEFIKQGNKVIFYFAIPVSLFIQIYAADLSDVFDVRFLAFNSLWLVGFFIVVWVVASKFMKDKDSVSSFANSAYRSSLSVVGPPLLTLMFEYAYDSNILPKGILAVAVLLIISYVTASILFAVHDSKSNKNGTKRFFILGVFISIIKNPIIIGVVAGLIFNFSGLPLPTFANNTLTSFSRIVMPLAMICVGANLRFHGFDKKFKYVLISAFVKLVVMPIAAVIVAYLFGFRGSDLTIILILNALPMAVGAYVMQAELGGDSYIGASVLMLTMTLSAVTLTLYIFLFRVMGFL
ncbi:MAG: AEC family transporter [Oscillospiraceae bacterium]|nr:AEC family transporter [Oscillospiraceae bacterium]